MQSDNVSPAEKISAMIEEQALTREELLTMLRQIMEIRALDAEKAKRIVAEHLEKGKKVDKLAIVKEKKPE